MPWLSPLPVTAREAWQMTALATGPDLRPLIAVVPPDGGFLVGRAVLSCRDDGRTLHIGIPRPGSGAPARRVDHRSQAAVAA